MGRKQDPNTPATIEAIRRVARESGKAGKWVALASELNKREIFSPQGAVWKGNSLSIFCKRHVFKESPQDVQAEQPDTEEPSAPPEAGIPNEPQDPDNSFVPETSPDQDQQPIPESDVCASQNAQDTGMAVEPEPVPDWQTQMRAIAREVCQEMIEAMMPLQHMQRVSVDGEEAPPKPVTIKGPGVKGRKETRQYERLTVGIDVVLAEKFKAEAEALNLSPGKLLDRILWNRYGMPRLSYQQPEPDDNDIEI